MRLAGWVLPLTIPTIIVVAVLLFSVWLVDHDKKTEYQQLVVLADEMMENVHKCDDAEIYLIDAERLKSQLEDYGNLTRGDALRATLFMDISSIKFNAQSICEKSWSSNK